MGSESYVCGFSECMKQLPTILNVSFSFVILKLLLYLLSGQLLNV